MADETPKETPKEKPELYVETLAAQIAASQRTIATQQAQLNKLTDSIQQEIGILNYAKFLLSQYKVASKPKPVPPKPAAPTDVVK